MNKPFWLTILCLITLCVGGRAEFPAPQKAVKGVLDLSNTDLGKSIVSLDGEWGFYWKQLYSSKRQPLSQPVFVPYPSLWNNLKLDEGPLPATGYCTYELTLILPRSRPSVSIEAPDAYS